MRFLLNIIEGGLADGSKGFEPGDEVRVLAPFSSVTLEQGLGFGEGLPFCFEIDGDIFVCRVDARVPQPMGDRTEINPGAQQVKGRRVTHRVRMQPFAFQ